jgi:hypothetical protein
MSDIDRQDVEDQGVGSVVHRSYHNTSGGTELSTEILLALDSVGFDTEDSKTVAFDHVDLEALDRLVESMSESQSGSHVEFSIDQYRIAVTASGEITVREQTYPRN